MLQSLKQTNAKYFILAKKAKARKEQRNGMQNEVYL